jgi:hypothetical protein
VVVYGKCKPPNTGQQRAFFDRQTACRRADDIGAAPFCSAHPGNKVRSVIICHSGCTPPPNTSHYVLCQCLNSTAYFNILVLLTKQQFFITHTIRKIENPALLDIWVTSTPSVKMLCPQTNCVSLYFRKNITRLSVDLWRLCQSFSVSCKIALSVGYDTLLFHKRNVNLQVRYFLLQKRKI